MVATIINPDRIHTTCSLSVTALQAPPLWSLTTALLGALTEPVGI